ncbi:MAG: YraN family protein [Opitutae bacterium]|nr:YraN family protein [Opitutae bacterium]
MVAWLKAICNRLRPGAPAAADSGGARGEDAAAEFLQSRHGFSIVARNWRSPRDRRDEIDLVARDGDVLVFVEVKARGVQALVPGFYAVDRRKKRVLRRAVHVYLSALSHPPRTFRFDVVEVALSDRLPPQCLHFANVPLFPKGYHVARQTNALDEVGRRSGAR